MSFTLNTDAESVVRVHANDVSGVFAYGGPGNVLGPSILGTPGLTGFLIYVPWNSIRLDANTLDLSSIQGYFANALPGQKIKLALVAGQFTPDYIDENGIDEFNGQPAVASVFIDQSYHSQPMQVNKAATWGHNFVELYLRDLAAIVASLTATQQALLYEVNVAIQGNYDVEWQVPCSSSGNMDYTDVQAWINVGFTPTKAVRSLGNVISRLFRILPLSVAVASTHWDIDKFYPACTDVGGLILDHSATVDANTAILEGLWTHMGNEYPGRAVAMDSGYDGTFPLPDWYSVAAAAGASIGLQFTTGLNSPEMLAGVELGVAQGFKYYEIHMSQIKNDNTIVQQLINVIAAG